MNKALELFKKTRERLGIKPTERILLVRIETQTLQFYRGGELVRGYAVSTSRRPPSNRKDSLGTPRGLHKIVERIGGEQPAGMVFKGRLPTGHHFSEIADDSGASANLITSRILRLQGLEAGVNAGTDAEGKIVDTYARYVYIHGTNREDCLGTPQSAGCVLMGNLDIIGLFDEVRNGDLVWIE